MAPKPDKNKEKAKAKVIEDKTFGIKNKKGKAVQQYVKQLENSMAPNAKQIRAQAAAPAAKDKKKMEEEKAKELAALFAVAIKQPKIPAGVDPKSVVCEFFRHGQCTKGFKCKYSHDLSVERKGPKIDLFTDQRDLADKEAEGMEDWDQETLEKAIKEKHANEKPSNATTIICKYFLDAVEKKTYGWFWKCPSGAECKYRHALPPGYVLKSQMKELLEEEARNQRDVADIIEEERSKVDGKTPINEEVFQAWHRKRTEDKRKRKEEAMEERKKKGVLTGREIFMQEGFTAEDDANANDEDERDQAEEDRKIQEMLDKAAEDARQARAKALAERPPENGDGADEDGNQQAGPSTHVQLADDEAEELFDDDDDDDMDDEAMLEQLEQGIKATQVQDG